MNNKLERIDSLLADYRLGFLETAKPRLEIMSARLRFGKELSKNQSKELDGIETCIHNLNPVGKKMTINDEEALVISVNLPREEGDVPAYPKEGL